MKIFQGKTWQLYFDNLSICATQSKTMQVETIHKLIKSNSYISLNFSDWLLTPGNKVSVTPIEEMNKEELNACLKS